MGIELRVDGQLQDTAMSCWWTAVSVVLAYYGRRHTHPSSLSGVFSRPLSMSSSTVGYENPSLDQLMRVDPTLRIAHSMDRLAPYEWYQRGLPNSAWGLRRLCEITGLRGVPSCPRYGQWTAAETEQLLRTCGPMVFHGFWNGFPHSIVLCGVHTNVTPHSVAIMDPASGFVSSLALTNFNLRMDGMTVGQDAVGLNPIYYPNPEPVREVVAEA